MARKIVAIHGIGNAQPGWSEFLRVDLDIPKKDWIEFCYDDLLERSVANRLIVSATRLYLSHAYGPEAMALATSAEDYINDIITYFLFQKSRLQIQLRLKTVLKKYPDAVILSHSLGTVVAYETLKNFDLKAHTLFTLGSPLSKALVRRFLHVPDSKRPEVKYWFNLWGTFDPIGGKIEGLGCRAKEQIKLRVTHDFLGYVHAQKRRIRMNCRDSRKMAS